MITVLTKQPGEDLQQEEWEEITLKQCQDAVGGWIESAVEGTDWICYCNEDGRLKGMAPNIRRPHDGHLILGPVVFVGLDEAGDDVGLTIEQIALVKTMFGA